MAPKKGKKIALSEFLGDSTLGSWADEVDSLPNAPAPKLDDDAGHDSRFSRRDDGFRGDRPGFAREEVPLPTQPPYTAFIGNLAFDISEADIANHFSDFKTNSVKIIKDRDDKPKGFGYVEFESLDGLKDALSKSGTSLAGRTVRVSVAEPPKERERSGFGGGHDRHEDDSKFDNPWRRDGPLPDLPGRGDRDNHRRRFDGPPPDRASGAGDSISDWRSSRPPRAAAPEPEYKRKGSGQFASDSAADKEDNWTIGSRFKPSEDTGSRDTGSRFGSLRREHNAPPPGPADEDNWRGAARPRIPRGSGGGSPVDSVPSTPQMGRRKLELLPKSGSQSTAQTPLSSPKMASAQAAKANPFGAAKPVDVSQREKEVEEKLEKEKETHRERHTMSRTSSRTASERTPANRISSPTTTDSKAIPASPKPSNINLAPSVRPTLSFANAAAVKKAAIESAEATSKATTEAAAE